MKTINPAFVICAACALCAALTNPHLASAQTPAYTLPGQSCPNGQCPRVQAAVQTVSATFRPAPVANCQPQAATRPQPIRNAIRAIFGRK